MAGVNLARGGRIESGSIFFTAPPGGEPHLPRPFLAAGRTVTLLETERPKIALLGYGLGAMAAIMLELRTRAHLTGVEVDPALVRAEIEAAGFVLEAESFVLRNPRDTHDWNVFRDGAKDRDRTDRFVYLFRKPAE